MSDKLVELKVVSPSQSLFEGAITSVTVKGSEGELGIQYGHAPLFTKINPCMLKYTLPDSNVGVLYVAGGFLEVQPTQVNLLADSAIRAEDIDEQEAQKARDVAETRLEKCDVQRFLSLEIELMKATAQLQVAEYYKKLK